MSEQEGKCHFFTQQTRGTLLITPGGEARGSGTEPKGRKRRSVIVQAGNRGPARGSVTRLSPGWVKRDVPSSEGGRDK